MTDEKNQIIKSHVSEQIKILNEELNDRSLYKKNSHPDELSFVENIEEGEE